MITQNKIFVKKQKQKTSNIVNAFDTHQDITRNIF